MCSALTSEVRRIDGGLYSFAFFRLVPLLPWSLRAGPAHPMQGDLQQDGCALARGISPTRQQLDDNGAEQHVDECLEVGALANLPRSGRGAQAFGQVLTMRAGDQLEECLSLLGVVVHCG